MIALGILQQFLDFFPVDCRCWSFIVFLSSITLAGRMVWTAFKRVSS